MKEFTTIILFFFCSLALSSQIKNTVNLLGEKIIKIKGYYNDNILFDSNIKKIDISLDEELFFEINKKKQFPVSENYYENSFSLPIYYGLNLQDLKKAPNAM